MSLSLEICNNFVYLGLISVSYNLAQEQFLFQNDFLFRCVVSVARAFRTRVANAIQLFGDQLFKNRIPEFLQKSAPESV